MRRKAAVATLVVTLAMGSAHAADLGAEITTMFNDLGGVSNYTAPGAFRGQTMNTYTGGNFYMRTPSRTYQLATIALPNVRAGCGGIDVFGGSFSHISADGFKDALKKITAALPGAAFSLALKSVSPVLADVNEYLKTIETTVNNARINSCETAKAIVSTAAEAAGLNDDDACIKLARQQNAATDEDEAKRLCATQRSTILGNARTSSDATTREQAPFAGNLTWSALKKIDGIDDQTREILMSMIGTYIIPPDSAVGDPTPIPPTLDKIELLLYGQNAVPTGAAGAPAPTAAVTILHCADNYDACINVVATNTTITPLAERVSALMRSISDKISNREAIPNSSPEVAFVNSTSLPVWRMLSVANTTRNSLLAEALIVSYRDWIAADYAFVFLDRFVRMAIVAMEKTYHLPRDTRALAAISRDRARDMLHLLALERNNQSSRRTAISSVAQELEQMERNLRSSMPQYVVEMLGVTPVSYR